MSNKTEIKRLTKRTHSMEQAKKAIEKALKYLNKCDIDGCGMELFHAPDYINQIIKQDKKFISQLKD